MEGIREGKTAEEEGKIKDGNERKARGDSGTWQLYNYRTKLTTKPDETQGPGEDMTREGSKAKGYQKKKKR